MEKWQEGKCEKVKQKNCLPSVQILKLGKEAICPEFFLALDIDAMSAIWSGGKH
jgi:hypothetical protein